MRIYTIGHSTRTTDELALLLKQSGVQRLADVRRYPGSRRLPHFSRERLEADLAERGLSYVHVPELGGRRAPARSSPNGAWDSDQFRGYADHMGTDEFRAAVDRLLDSTLVTAVMCAEAVPWRCHRNLLSDDLVRRGVEVVHIVGPGQRSIHALNPMARLLEDRVIYPPEQGTLGF